MPLTPAERDKLQDYQTMMGIEAGALALALDNLTDIMALLGQHKVYCRVEKGPRTGQPPLDLQEILEVVGKTKGLVQDTMLKLRSKE